jgi:hypothetical protein
VNEDLARLFGDHDREQLSEHAIELSDAVRQLELLREPGSRFRHLERAARIGDGIRRIDSRFVADLLLAADDARRAGRVSKFVPASGAATRMFQSLLRALDEFECGTIGDEGREEVARFLSAIPRLALRFDLKRAGISPEDPVPAADRDLSRLLYRILSATEVGLATRPKGLVPFHEDGGRARTPFEEHLLESILYTRDANDLARAHFTVPEEHRSGFEAALESCRGDLESAHGVRLDVTFSTQHSSTDMICVSEDGLPFRDEGGQLVLRPGGHGALLGNLHETSGDLVVIKNIDNVVPSSRVGRIAYWKKILIGYLATLQQSVNVYLREILEDGSEPQWLDQGLVFAEQHLSIPVPPGVKRGSVDEKRTFLVRVLDRPMRVCGMVRNEGEPGGGPFWVRDEKDRLTLQIVEAAEVDRSDPKQARVLKSATYFNPVDLVVGLRNWRGEPFDLARYSNPDSVIKTMKSSFGRSLVALERPGLWNGAMADWTTVFIEVPTETFAPVKTVFDLLRPEHQ